MGIYFYMSDSPDGWRNLAVDGFFLENVNKDDVVLYLYINSNAVIVGKCQNAWRECNLDAMEKDGVQLVRRHTGGGAVYHDSGNLNFSFIMGEDNYDLTRQMSVIQRAVAGYGMTAELSGRNDILIDGKKFSGNAFASSKGRRAHHGTILINTDMTKLSGYLNASEKKLSAKGIKSVRSRVCNLSEFNPEATVDGMVELLKSEFTAEYGAFEEYKFGETERKRVDELYAAQSSWEWRFGKTPVFDYQIDRRFSFGEAQIMFRVREGKVEDVLFFSDALDTHLAELVKNALIGAKFTSRDAAEKLVGYSSRDELKEIADCIRSVEF